MLFEDGSKYPSPTSCYTTTVSSLGNILRAIDVIYDQRLSFWTKALHNFSVESSVVLIAIFPVILVLEVEFEIIIE
jgi:hypothetical protein